MANITEIHAREILDSRGNPTVSCEILLDDATYAVSYVPSGASTGDSEAIELRDGDAKRYNGKGVLKAVGNVNTTIRNSILGMDIQDLAKIDQKMLELDGTANKGNLGANAILSVSLASAKAGAKSARMPLYQYLGSLMGKRSDKLVLPIPFFNILNGGKHAIGSTDFQEFMIVPVKFASFKEAYRAAAEIFHALGSILEERNYQPLVGDEGGYAPALFSNEQAMELLMLAIAEANYRAGEDVFLALDPAASRIYTKDNFYELHRENKSLTSDELISFYQKWTEKYPIISIEDPLDQADWDAWREITQRIGDKVEIIGDDIYVTNKELLKKGIDSKASTGILIKPNQIGTVTEMLQTIKMAEDAGFKVIISHRSGETEDTFIADLAVATGCGTIKSGAPCRSERTAKYNRLCEIEEKNQGNISLATWSTANDIAV
ncbi:MAG TPA: phosphopyruvate hydratase [Patescibacteria group bacterium]|nr:phosphopyruvate hydratase [Patescibacteria group bacterium]